MRGVTRYLVRWRGHTSADDEWLRLEELAHCPEKVAEYDAAAPRRRAALRAGPDAAPVPAPAGYRSTGARRVTVAKDRCPGPRRPPARRPRRRRL